MHAEGSARELILYTLPLIHNLVSTLMLTRLWIDFMLLWKKKNWLSFAASLLLQSGMRLKSCASLCICDFKRAQTLKISCLQGRRFEGVVATLRRGISLGFAVVTAFEVVTFNSMLRVRVRALNCALDRGLTLSCRGLITRFTR